MTDSVDAGVAFEERRKWFPIRSKPVQVEGIAKRGRRRRKTGSIDEDVEEEEATAATENDDDHELEADEEEILDQNLCNGWDLNMLRSNMFAFIDGEGNIVYEKIDKEDEKKGTEDKGAYSILHVSLYIL